MIAPLCPHERDVLDLVAIGQWPRRADAELRAHVAACEACAEVAEIAGAVREWSESDPVTTEDMPAQVPDASVVWHRAQVKARAAAARAASRPVWVAQAVALVALVVAVVWLGPSAGWYASVWSGVKGAVPTVSVHMPAAPALVQEVTTDGAGLVRLMTSVSPTILAAAGALALLASVAFAGLRTSEDR